LRGMAWDILMFRKMNISVPTVFGPKLRNEKT